MKILFLTRLFYPHIGGVEKHVLEISKHLVKKGHSVTVLTEQYENQLNGEDEIDGIKIIRINNGKDNWFKKFRVWKNLFKYRKLIKKSDIVHAHDVFFWYLPFRFLYPSKKVFTTFHGYEGNKIPRFKEKLMHKIAEKLSSGNICVGDFLKKWYGTKPDYVTYGAVNRIQNSEFRIQNYHRQDGISTGNFNRDNSKFKILFLGRLEEETGIMEYLKALRMLRNKGIEFELTFLGDGKLKRNAENFSRANKIDAKFMGFVENTEGYLQNCDFVFVSRYLGILEALAYKKSVFAVYNNPIKKDYLKITPFVKFISIGSSDRELLSNIEYFLKNKLEKENMINNGYSWVKNKTWDNIVNIYIDLWRQK